MVEWIVLISLVVIFVIYGAIAQGSGAADGEDPDYEDAGDGDA